MLIVRVRGLADDQIGIVLQSAGNPIKNILPQVPKPRYSYRTWRDSRWHHIRRMLLCLYVYASSNSGLLLLSDPRRAARRFWFACCDPEMADLWGSLLLPHALKLRYYGALRSTSHPPRRNQHGGVSFVPLWYEITSNFASGGEYVQPCRAKSTKFIA
jgi:hypothetical protein